MEKIQISKGLKIKLAGMADTSLTRIPPQNTVAVSALDITHIRPKLLVKERQPVKTGTPLFCDKRDQSIQYVSPATGTIKKIIFGQRRRLLEVVIEFDPQDSFIAFESFSRSDIDLMQKEQLIAHLKKGGLWQCFRQFPSKDHADSDHHPPLIIVSLNGNDIFSPYPEILLDNQHDIFEFGLEILKKFTPRIVVQVNESHYEKLGPIQKWITHTVPDMFPSWDPGVVLYHLKQSADDNLSWCISLDHLMMISKFMSTGQYPVEKVITLKKSGSNNAHILTRQGVSIKTIDPMIDSNHMITTGLFNGRILSQNDHLGFFENTIHMMPSSQSELMFGFIRPGIQSHSVSNTFLSSLRDIDFQLDASLHGEERACINCGYCESICPNDIMPHFLMKALASDNIEEALQLGLLDCCRCGLCSYTCPSKIELTTIFSNAIDTYYKDKA
jgi:Na+-transporting NADH:ubiquinone oxidoreductase subunit A